MIPNFSTYNILKESVSLKDIQKNKKPYGVVKRDLTSKGYDFLGNITVQTSRYSNPKYDVILDFVPDELCQKLSKKEARGFLSSVPYKFSIDFSIWGIDDKSKVLTIFDEENTEDVIACITNAGDLYYALYNDEKKYFYYMTSKKDRYSSNDSARGFLELYIKVRTSSVEEVSKEIDDYCDEYSERQRAEEEERQRKEEERRIQKEKEEEERRIKKEKEDAYQKRVDAIKADVEENPENYEMVDSWGLPNEIEKEINSDDYMDSKYVKYVRHGRHDPYDNEQIVVYINDDDLTKGYKYISSISHARPGTYWGD